MTIQLVKEGKNGQLEFDFESLAAVVSQGFAEYVSDKLQSVGGDYDPVVFVDFKDRGSAVLRRVSLLLRKGNHCFNFECVVFINPEGVKKEEYINDWMLLQFCQLFLESVGEKK